MKITVLAGDGIGPEITDAALAVMEKTAEVFGLDISYDHKLMGGCAYDRFGTPLPEETVASAKAADGVLLGAVGGPKWDHIEDVTKRPEKGLLGIRKALGLYCNLRPVQVRPYMAHLSPLKTDRAEGADLVIVRELTGGIYFGEHKEAALVDGVETASDVEKYTRPEVERIAVKAFEAARLRRGKVTSVDKANVLGSSRMWRKIVEELHDAKYPDVELNHFYVDNCAMQLVLNPKQFDVILTNNIFGDILSDEASTIAGSIGLLPSASLGDGTGLYEHPRQCAGYSREGHRQPSGDHPVRRHAAALFPPSGRSSPGHRKGRGRRNESWLSDPGSGRRRSDHRGHEGDGPIGGGSGEKIRGLLRGQQTVSCQWSAAEGEKAAWKGSFFDEGDENYDPMGGRKTAVLLGQPQQSPVHPIP